MDSTYLTLNCSRDDRGVVKVTLNRPNVRNAFNETVIEELTKLFKSLSKDASVRAVVLAGEGPVFCAGGDLNWMQKSVEFSFDQNLEDTRRLSRMFQIMNEFPRPVIGLIQGAAIGGGVGLVSICDIAIASQEAKFSLSEVRLGIVPACIGPFVVAKIGASHARSLFVSAERFGVKRAHEIGLIHEVVESPADLARAAEEKLANILACGPSALSIAKKLVLDLSWPERRETVGDPLEHVSRVLAEVRISAEGQEGVRAFLEKRKPSWLS